MRNWRNSVILEEKMKNINIIYKKIDELKPYKNNPRKNDKAVKAVADSIKEFGFKVPIILDSNMEIIAGHTRLKAAKRLKYKEVPCIIADDLTPDQVRAFRLVDNKVGEFAEWDIDLLNIELSEIELDLTPFDFKIKKTINDVEEDDFEVVLPEEPKSKKGDIYILGNHRLMCGDSTSKKDVNKLMNNEVAKCLFTSPPYNMASNLYASYTDSLESKKYIEFNMKIINVWLEYLKGYLFWNISYNKNSRWEFIEILYKIVKETGMRFMELIVWDKGHGMPIVSKDMLTRQYEDILLVGDEEEISKDMELYYLGTTEKRGYFNKKKGKGITNYWRITTGNTQLDNHKACFPIKLPAQAIELTTNENDIVVDCFGGSGTTLMACEQLNRNCYMMELDEKYVDVIINRWEKFTGRKAVKVE